MLEPHARTLLFDVLRPPDDYSLDYAIATTFTLDLLALLTAPVAFTLFEADDHRDLLQANSLTLLESLRRYADRLSVFTQAGHISLPKARFPQLEFLENAVIECRVNTGLFHPKVWVLRFAGPQGAVRYRFACLSRNLTFDRCWDTTLTLEGPLRDRRNGFAANRPLLEFLQALPAMSVHALGSEATDRIRQFADELARVEFELPEGFTEFRFHPLGISPRRRLPFEDVGGRMLAVSPFISEDGLKRIMAGRPGSLLVTREDSLARVGLGVPEIARCYVMRDVVETDGAGADEEEPPTARGLHAKCYIAESGWNAHVWTGSANATSAGFNGNVEFLVELIGLKSRVGIDALFDEEAGKTSFGDMLDPVSPPDHPETDDSDERAFASAVDRVRDALIARVSLEVEEADTGFRLSLRASEPLDLPGDLQVTCWPATLGEGYAVTVQAGSRMPEFSVSLEGITAFMAFKAASPDGEFENTFVLNLPLSGAPPDRRDRLLRAAIQDRERFLRYLLLLLAAEGFELAGEMSKLASRSHLGETAAAPEERSPLLESLLRTLIREPHRLDHVARLVEDLRRQPEGADLLPPDFQDVWAPIWRTRERLR